VAVAAAAAPAEAAGVPLAGAPGPAGPAPAGAPDERFFAPAVFSPVSVTARHEAPRRRVPVGILVTVVVLACAAVATYVLAGSGSGDAGSSGGGAPVALAPVGEAGAITDALRVQAEAARQQAFTVIAQASAEMGPEGIDLHTLRAMHPNLEWLPGNAASNGPNEVSFAQDGETYVVAIRGKGKELCAYGRMAGWDAPEYVTMTNVAECRADRAPASGWAQRSRPGGAAAQVGPPLGMEW
jgi:hypothetical protein